MVLPLTDPPGLHVYLILKPTPFARVDYGPAAMSAIEQSL